MSANPYISYNGSDGGYIDYSDPQPGHIKPHDIALSLSREARYNGMVGNEHGYSVAQHSVLVSLLVPKSYALAGLFHDGSEAYLRDIATPAKRLLPDYQQLEAKVQGAIHRAVNLPAVLDNQAREAIKLADQIALATEVAYIMPRDMAKHYNCKQAPIAPILFATGKLTPMAPHEARDLFMSRFESIICDKEFHEEHLLWTVQEHSIPLEDAIKAIACLITAGSLSEAGQEHAARAVADKVLPLWPAPIPRRLHGSPLDSLLKKGAALLPMAGAA